MTNDADSPLARALAILRTRAGEMHAMTRRWVEVNSYTTNVAGVNAVGAMLRADFAIPSLALTAIAGGPEYGGHLV
ncbi:MAG TPA: hypothetical protein VGO00_20920, partial [Kofleriaceae bacterium]|nr:hypothetical protein [Kofleriaceae bacterium]